MAWGGSLNSDGSDYIRKVMEAEKIVKYLESLKEEVTSEERKNFEKTIRIITKYVMNLTQDNKEDAI